MPSKEVPSLGAQLGCPPCIAYLAGPSPHPLLAWNKNPDRWTQSHTSSASDTWSGYAPFQHGPELHPGQQASQAWERVFVCGELNIVLNQVPEQTCCTV